MRLELLGTKVSVLVTEVPNQTESGIILPSTGEKSNRGIVVKKGLKCEDENIQVGSVVLFQPHQGTTLDYEGTKYQLFQEDSILAVVPDDD